MKPVLIENGVLSIDPIMASVKLNDEPVNMGTRLYRFLMQFVQHMGSEVRIEDITKDLGISKDNFYVCVNRLRNLLGQEYFQTLGLGRYSMPYISEVNKDGD
jgi:DNA-binding winged helix-turn-helix (wHTH) protein